MLVTKVSLIINVLVLIPVCCGLMLDLEWAKQSYGEASPARGILLSVYLAILCSSVLLFFFRPNDVKFIASLLFVQVVYKLTTPFTVRSLKNPVVISNLFIAGFHLLTLCVLRQKGKIEKCFFSFFFRLTLFRCNLRVRALWPR
jgi:hypothetical protein